MKTSILALAAGLFVAALFYFGQLDRPAAWKPEEIPISFWAWRNQNPSSDAVRAAKDSLQANTIYLRAGQLDLAQGSTVRIRAPLGDTPTGIETHLAYNATRGLLENWKDLDPGATAAFIAEVYRRDKIEAESRGSKVGGIQLDLDVPTGRLLSYAELLSTLRTKLPEGTILSITGLPTWIGSASLPSVLEQVDLWIPQCYGLTRPKQLGERSAVSTSKEVAAIVSGAARLGRPFNAGLSAYGYAALFDTDGELVEIRGDFDPSLAASSDQLELVTTNAGSSRETFYLYRSKQDAVIDGTIIRSGETLMLEIPSHASLRASAAAVRDNGGKYLKGITIFRLPTDGDRTALKIREIASALKDEPAIPSTEVAVRMEEGGSFRLIAENTGTTRSELNDEAFMLDLAVQPESIKGVGLGQGFTSFEWLCTHGEDVTPCSRKRANTLRFRSRSWIAGDIATTSITARLAPLQATVSMRLDSGQLVRKSIDITKFTGE